MYAIWLVGRWVIRKWLSTPADFLLFSYSCYVELYYCTYILQQQQTAAQNFGIERKIELIFVESLSTRMLNVKTWNKQSLELNYRKILLHNTFIHPLALYIAQVLCLASLLYGKIHSNSNIINIKLKSHVITLTFTRNIVSYCCLCFSLCGTFDIFDIARADNYEVRFLW